MASDEKEFNRAMAKWDRMRQDQRYSDPAEYGQTAILYSGYSMLAGVENRQNEIEGFDKEARAIERDMLKRRTGAFVIARFTLDDFYDTLRADEVSSMIVIGNGSLSTLAIDGERWLTWKSVSDIASHLKTGTFTQRFCGHLSQNLNVPFGTFAMKEQRNVRAATGHMLPAVLDKRHEKLLRPVHDKTRLDYRTVKELFPPLATEL